MTRRASLWLAVMLAAPLALGQTLDSRLDDLARKLPRHTTAAPGTAQRLGDGIEQIRATLAQLAAGDTSGAAGALRDERRKLLTLDEAYQAEFARIESTLRRAGLTPAELDEKLAIWRRFTSHYRQRMDASLTGFDRLSRGGASQREIAALRTGLGEPDISPRKQPPAPPSTLPPPSLPALTEAIRTATPDVPTPDELAETSVVKLSSDIRTLAASLGNSPAAIYAYVYNNIHWVPYILAMQNSEAVLWSKRGNDADQATLLIALLRAAGVPARYVTASINIPFDDAINWTGAKDKLGALNLLLASTTVGANMGDQIQIQHTWVEAWVDNSWIAVSPSLKKQTFQPGLPLSIPVFDRAKFLSAPTTRLATDVYADQIHAALAQSFPGHDLSELGYTGTIIPAAADKLPPFPYTPIKVFTRAGALPQTAQWKTTLTLFDSGTNKVYLSSTFFLPEICLQSVTLSYTAATPADQSIIDSFGGIANVPAGMVNLLAQFRLDDAVVATSTVPTAVPQFLALGHAIAAPNATAPITTNTFVAVGGPGAVVLVGPQIGNTWIGSRIDGILSRLPTASIDSTLRETLFLAGLLHNQQLTDAWAQIFQPLQYASDYSLQTPFGTFLSAQPTITRLFDRPFLATSMNFYMDDRIDPPHPFNLNAPAGTAMDINPFRAADVTLSQSECRTFERVALVGSVCTVSALQTASQHNIPILVINKSNAAALLPTIAQLRPDMLSYFQGIVPFGTITIPNRPTVSGTWSGFPWILDWDNFYANSFFGLDYINGGLGQGNGAPAPAGTNPGVTGDPTPVNGTTCSDPVTVSNGNMFQQQTDLAISSRGPAFLLARTYNSFFAANNGPFGYGWTHSYTTSLKDNGSTVTLVNGSGGVYAFVFQNGVYASPPGLDLKLTKDAQGYTMSAKHGTQSRFDTNGVLQSIADRNGNAMKLGYDTSGRLTTLTDALNRVVTLSYDGSNHIVSARDFSGRQVTYAYDIGGNLASVTDFAGNRTDYAYYRDSLFNHLLQKVTKPAGNSTSFEYYVNKQTARISDSAGRNMRFLYLPFSHQTIFIDARGFASSYYYDTLGEVTRVVKADGNYIDTTFTTDAKVASMTDEDGNVTRFTYDAAGNMTSAVDGLGRTVKLAYEPTFNMVTSVTDAQGKAANFEYDTRGNLVHTIRPRGVEARVVYDSFGEAISATDPEGNTANITYDASGNPITITDPLGNATQLQFDQLRRPAGIADALGDTSIFQFDALDRLAQATDPLGNSASAAYDPNGNLAQTIDGNGHATRFSYDALDNLAQVTDAKAGVTQYGYSVPGCGCTSGSDLIAHRNAAGETRSLLYDFNHWLMQSTDAAGASTGFVYNSRGDIVQRTDANGKTMKFEYDAVHQLVHKVFPDGSDARFSYDANGNLTAASNLNASLTFSYDDLNRLTSVTESRFGKTIQYAYNRNGLRTTLTDSEGGATVYAYDAASNLTALTNPSGGAVQFTYDALNRPSALAYSNGIGTSAAYDAAGRLTTIAYSSGQSGSMAARGRKRTNARASTAPNAGSALAQFLYSYDQNGNRTSIADLTGTHSYQFDELNRLTAAAHPTLNAENYSYDGAGNRTASANDSNYSYDSLGRLTRAEGVAYSYDANGNLVGRTDSNGTTAYTYDYENQLIGIAFPDGTTAAYLYDALGRRIQKNVNGSATNYLYDGANILLELDSGGAMQARYTHGPGVDNVLMMERGGQTYYYHADAMGSIAAVTDSSGNTACGYLYDSFGRTQPCQSLTTPYGFAGREYDAESGLYFMRARYFDPATGRFIRPDPLDLTGRLLTGNTGTMGDPQQLNRYSYALNNPLAFRDPSGLGCSGSVVGKRSENGYLNGPGYQWNEHDNGWNGPRDTEYLLSLTDPQTGDHIFNVVDGRLILADGYDLNPHLPGGRADVTKVSSGVLVSSFASSKWGFIPAADPQPTWANHAEAVAGSVSNAAAQWMAGQNEQYRQDPFGFKKHRTN
jgi:RHS repeat-associated protein